MAHAAVGETAMALEVLKRAESFAPGNAQVSLQKAWVLSSAGESVGAHCELRKVADSRPRDSGVMVQLGKLCTKLGKTEEALLWLNSALEALTPPAGILGGAIALGPAATAAAATAAGSDKARNAVRALIASLHGGKEKDNFYGQF
jgi:lipopolysaccharide biosynthesis regulator YciM